MTNSMPYLLREVFDLLLSGRKSGRDKCVHTYCETRVMPGRILVTCSNVASESQILPLVVDVAPFTKADRSLWLSTEIFSSVYYAPFLLMTVCCG